MALVDEVGNLVRDRVNRVNPQASIFNKPKQPIFDWLSNSINVATEAVKNRRAQDQMVQNRQVFNDPNEGRNTGSQSRTRILQQSDDARQRAQERMADPVWSWVHSSDGYRFLSGGGAEKVDFNEFERDPDKFLIRNPSIREGIGMSADGFGTALQERGVPDAVISRLYSYLNSDKGAKEYKPFQPHVQEGALTSLAGEIDNPVGRTLAQGAIDYMPILTAIDRGSGSGDMKQGLLDVGKATALSGAFGAAKMGAESIAAKRGLGEFAPDAASKFGERFVPKPGASAFLQRLGINTVAQGAANSVPGLPFNIATAINQGYDLRDPEVQKFLAMQTAFDAVGGAGFNAAGEAGGQFFKGLGKFVPRKAMEFTRDHPGAKLPLQAGSSAGATYGIDRLILGKDDEQAQRDALMAGLAPYALHGVNAIQDRLRAPSPEVANVVGPKSRLGEEFGQTLAAGERLPQFSSYIGPTPDVQIVLNHPEMRSPELGKGQLLSRIKNAYPREHEELVMDYIRRGNEYQRAIDELVSSGRLDIQTADELGADMFHYEKDGVPLPEHVYHTTTAKDAVLNEGLKPRDMVAAQKNGTGLGGGDNDKVSITDSLDAAANVRRGILELRGLASREIDPTLLLEAASSGRGAEAPYLETFLKRAKLPPDPEAAAKQLQRIFDVGTDSDKIDVYNGFADARMYAGGPKNPYFSGTQVFDLANIPEDQIAILRADRANPDAMGLRIGDKQNSEIRLPSGASVDVNTVLNEPRELFNGRLAFNGGEAQARNPLRDALTASAASAIYQGATTDGDLEDRLKAAGKGALAGLAYRGLKTDALKNVVKSSKVGDYKIGSRVFTAGGYSLGTLRGIDDNGNLVVDGWTRNPQGGSMKVRRVVDPATALTQADVLSNAKERALTKAIKPVKPEPQQILDRATEMNQVADQAAQLVNSPRRLGQLASKMGLGFADPAARFNTPGKKTVLTGAVAATAELRAQAANANAHVREAWEALRPMWEEGGPRIRKGFIDFSSHDAARAGAQLGALAVPAAAGYAAGEATDTPELKEAGILTGLVAMGAMSHAQKGGFMHDKPWEKIQLYQADPNMPAQLKSGWGKFTDIIERPGAYDIDPKKYPGVDQAIQNYLEVRRKYLQETNASSAAAGQPLTPFRQDNALFHWFTPESIKASGIGEGPSATEVHSPGFARQLPFEQQRNLGETYYEVLTNHPDLKIAGTPLDLLKEEAKMHSRIRSNAVLVKMLRDSGLSFGVLTDDQMRAAGMDDAARSAYKVRLRDLQENQKWTTLPGIEDTIFHPDVITGAKDLLTTTRGSENAFLNLLDDATNTVRQAMFVGDLSAWTMQGAMTFIEDPLAMIRNAHHLAGATVFGNRYFEWWLSKPGNADLYREFSRSGGVAGRTYEGLELQHENTTAGHLLSKASIATKPGFEHIEKRGFEAFLPIQRVLMWKNMRDSEALIRKSKLGGVPGSRLAMSALQAAPAAGATAAVATDNQIDIPGVGDNYDKLFTEALGLAGSLALSKGTSELGKKAFDAMTNEEKLRVNATTGKQINRISGNLNRQVLGITNQQGEMERVFMARSPALMRNTLTLAKLAMSPGNEGAMARVYLAKTAALVGVGLAGYKYLTTGKMDSFDPSDPESIFSLEGLMRANADAMGSMSPSNPLISLVRAVVHQEKPAGETRWKADNWRPDIGLKDWVAGRLPDVTGVGSKEALTNIFGDGLEDPMAKPQPSLVEKAFGGDPGGAAADVLKRFTPLTVQQSMETGLVGDTAIGDDLKLKGNPNYNHLSEKLANAFGGFAGVNTSPESLAGETARIKNETTHDLFPDAQDRTGDGVVSYDDLNSAQAGDVRSALDANEQYTKVKGQLDANHETENPTPIQAYIDAQTKYNNEYLTALKEADKQYRLTHDAFTFKATYQHLAEVRRDKLDTARELLGAASAQMRGRDESVEEWLNRNLKPEDAAVNGYYDLFDKATGPDGKLNFDRLETLQAKYMKALPSDTRGYVQGRIKSFEKPPAVKGLADYQAAKNKAKGYFDLRDNAFKQARAVDPLLKQFKTYSELETAVNQIAADNGLTPQEAMSALSETSIGLSLYNNLVATQGKVFRMMNPEADAALHDWYGFSAVNPVNKIAVTMGKQKVKQGYDFSAYDFGIH